MKNSIMFTIAMSRAQTVTEAELSRARQRDLFCFLSGGCYGRRQGE